jgi:hypothetical protein
MEITWDELQDMPADVVHTWRFFLAGEAEARRELAQRARANNSVTYTR